MYSDDKSRHGLSSRMDSSSIIRRELSGGILHAQEENEGVTVTKSEMREYFNAVSIVHSSSMMMKLLNSAMLNTMLIKQNKFNPQFEQVRNVFEIIDNFTKLFSSHIRQKNIKIIIDRTVYGEKDLVDLVKQQGFMLDVSIYE